MRGSFNKVSTMGLIDKTFLGLHAALVFCIKDNDNYKDQKERMLLLTTTMIMVIMASYCGLYQHCLIGQECCCSCVSFSFAFVVIARQIPAQLAERGRFFASDIEKAISGK